MAMFRTNGDPDKLDRIEEFECRVIRGSSLQELRAQCHSDGEEPLIFSHELGYVLTAVWGEEDLKNFADTTHFAFVAARRV